MNARSKDDSDRLDRLIHDYKALETALGLAIHNDELQLISQLDCELKRVQAKIIDFECQNDLERKQLFDFLMTNYIETQDVLATVPAKVTARIRHLFN